MSNRLERTDVNLLGVFVEKIVFGPGLNIIAGENGTLKSKLLRSIRDGSGQVTWSDLTAPKRVYAVSPKRATERRATEAMVNYIRQNNRTKDVVLAERASAQINESGFDSYQAFGDLYYVSYEDRCRDGGDRKKHMESTAKDFNAVVKQLFDQYELAAVWDEDKGSPTISMKKAGTIDVPIHQMSLGEQEILSLLMNLHVSRGAFDLYLIDEPETHLNWHLEERLFTFLKKFCDDNATQVIVTTHSRALFKAAFLPTVQFLSWHEGKVRCTRDLSEEQRRRLAGDAIEIVKLGSFTNATFFVEDTVHADVIGALADALGARVTVTPCGNSSNVVSLFRLSKMEGGWANTTFVVDGDNMRSPYPAEATFLRLDLYCMENYLLNIPIISGMAGMNEDDVRAHLCASIVENRTAILKHNKFLDFLIDGLKPEHMTPERLATLDASMIIDSFVSRLGLTRRTFLSGYIAACETGHVLDSVFPRRLIEAIRPAAVGDADVTLGDADAQLETTMVPAAQI